MDWRSERSVVPSHSTNPFLSKMMLPPSLTQATLSLTLSRHVTIENLSTYLLCRWIHLWSFTPCYCRGSWSGPEVLGSTWLHFLKKRLTMTKDKHCPRCVDWSSSVSEWFGLHLPPCSLGRDSGLPFDSWGSGIVPKDHMKYTLANGIESLHENRNDNSVKKSSQHCHTNYNIITLRNFKIPLYYNCLRYSVQWPALQVSSLGTIGCTK